MQMFDPYNVLGLSRTASAEAIKAAYRQNARKTHPDRGGAPEAFITVVKAFGVLSDPQAKRLFDETGVINEDGARNFRQDVAVILAEMFDTAVSTALQLGMPLEAVDFITQMAAALRSQRQQAEDGCKKLDGEIEALKTLRNRIRRQDENPNLFVQRLNDQVAAKVRDHAATSQRLALYETAAAELANYDSEVELFSALDMGVDTVATKAAGE